MGFQLYSLAAGCRHWSKRHRAIRSAYFLRDCLVLLYHGWLNLELFYLIAVQGRSGLICLYEKKIYRSYRDWPLSHIYECHYVPVDTVTC